MDNALVGKKKGIIWTIHIFHEVLLEIIAFQQVFHVQINAGSSSLYNSNIILHFNMICFAAIIMLKLQFQLKTHTSPRGLKKH